MPQQAGHAAEIFIKGVVGGGAEMTRRWMYQYSCHTKAIRKDKGHYTVKRLIQEENITLINIHVPNIGVPKCIKQILTDPKGETDGNIIIIGDFNTSLTPMDRSSKHKIKQETQVLNDAVDEMDLTDIFRTFHPNAEEYTFFSNAHGTFSRRDNILGSQIKPQ